MEFITTAIIPGVDRANMRTGTENIPALVCFAVKEEARFFRPPPGVEILIHGMGQANASKRVEEKLLRFQPKLVLTCGYAGGLDQQLASGSLVFEAPGTDSLHPKLSSLAVPGRFACTPNIAVTARDKARLWQETKATAVEMESQFIQRLCAERNIRCITLRTISDTAHEDMPLDFNKLLTSNYEMNWTRLAFELVRSPGKIPELMRFQKVTSSAARNLAQGLHSIFS